MILKYVKLRFNTIFQSSVGVFFTMCASGEDNSIGIMFLVDDSLYVNQFDNWYPLIKDWEFGNIFLLDFLGWYKTGLGGWEKP